MLIRDLFETKIEEKIEPVIKISETQDEKKLASEIGSYVVTPMIEKYLDDFLELYTDTFLTSTTEIGVWISGYFGSGKSHLAKIIGLLCENRKLAGSLACERFLARIPQSCDRHSAIKRSLSRMTQCDTTVLPYNLNTLTDSKQTPLSKLLLTQYYISRGYSSNVFYAKVIESELDKQGKLEVLHAAVEKRTKKKWSEIQNNLSFFSKPLYAATCEVAPDVFEKPEDVERALREAEKGEIFNVNFLVKTILDDVKRLEKEKNRSQRVMLVLDESGQWIENDRSRLNQLGGLIEEAADKGQGKIWIVVTTHGDMGSIYSEARALEGDMKKIEGRFRFKFGLTTENIELVLEDRLFKKTVKAAQELKDLYNKKGSGVLRGLGQLSNTSQDLTQCTEEKFVIYYPFFPYQVSLIPEIVKTIRSKGGRGEQLSGSTRTLLAITQDTLRIGRRKYLDDPVGSIVSFDEIFFNLSGEGEISPDVRTEISRIKDVVPLANDLTPKVAEVLHLIKELNYIPRTKDNIARLLMEHIDEDLGTILARVEPELEKLIKAKIVAKIGDEYEFLTGERRSFEDDVAQAESDIRQSDLERGFSEHFVYGAGRTLYDKWLGPSSVNYLGVEFPVKIQIDENPVPKSQGDITLKFISPLFAYVSVNLDDIESQSLRADSQNTIYILPAKVKGFEDDLKRYLAMKEVIDNWKGSDKSDDAKKLAQERDSNDLPKLEKHVVESLKEGIKNGKTVFLGSSQTIDVKPGQTPGESLHKDLSLYWPKLYPKFDKLPVKISNEQRAIQDVLVGSAKPGKDVTDLKIFDNAGKINPNSPLIDAIRMHLTNAQNTGLRVLGKDITEIFSAPPYGWDSNAVRVAIAALVRAGTVKILINKKPYTNPADRELQETLLDSRRFNKVQLEMEITDVTSEKLTEVRSFLMKLTKSRSIDETPAALSEKAREVAEEILQKASTVQLWANGSGLPLPDDFTNGEEAWKKVKALENPVHRVNEINQTTVLLEDGFNIIKLYAEFQTKNGDQFKDLEQFYNQAINLESRFKPDSSIRKLIEARITIHNSATFAVKESWKQLQSLLANAQLEKQSYIDEWRENAKATIEQALTQLPGDLKQHKLESLLDDLSKPLREFIKGLDDVKDLRTAANLKQQTQSLVKNLSDRIIEEKRKLDEKDKDKGAKKPKSRPVHNLKFNEISTVTRVTSTDEWESFKARLDERVKKLLDEGKDVEFGSRD